MFLGPFIYQNDVPKWALVQVGLYRIGNEPLSALGKSGSLEVVQDDPAGPMELTMSVDFGQSQATGGTVAIH